MSIIRDVTVSNQTWGNHVNKCSFSQFCPSKMSTTESQTGKHLPGCFTAGNITVSHIIP